MHWQLLTITAKEKIHSGSQCIRFHVIQGEFYFFPNQLHVACFSNSYLLLKWEHTQIIWHAPADYHNFRHNLIPFVLWITGIELSNKSSQTLLLVIFLWSIFDWGINTCTYRSKLLTTFLHEYFATHFLDALANDTNIHFNNFSPQLCRWPLCSGLVTSIITLKTGRDKEGTWNGRNFIWRSFYLFLQKLYWRELVPWIH